MARPKLLFLTSECPFPTAGGAHIRDAHLIQVLRKLVDVEILCFDTNDQPATPDCLPKGVRATLIPSEKGPIWQRTLSKLRPDVQAGYSEEMEVALRERAQPGKLLWISRLGMAKYLELGKKLGYRTILDQHQVETHVLWNNVYSSASQLKQLSQFPSAARGVTDLVHAAQCGYYEGRLCRLSDAVIATSDLDASRILKLAPKAPMHIIPSAIDCAKYTSAREHVGQTIFFSGALNYQPNIEGLQWFLSEVWTKLKRAQGDRCPPFVVAGTHPTAELKRMLDLPGIELHADPPSLLPFLSNAAVVVVPLRSGRSMRFKIMEAMASGRAVVSTPRGADGLVLAPGYDVWLADGADKFASAVMRFTEDTQLRSEFGIRAAQTADARYDWKSTRALVEALLQRLGHPTSE